MANKDIGSQNTVKVHCWAGKADQYEIGTDEWAEAMIDGATCLLLDGHDGPHEWTSNDDFVIEFAKAAVT